MVQKIALLLLIIVLFRLWLWPFVEMMMYRHKLDEAYMDNYGKCQTSECVERVGRCHSRAIDLSEDRIALLGLLPVCDPEKWVSW